MILFVIVTLVVTSAPQALGDCPTSCQCHDVPSEFDSNVLTQVHCPNFSIHHHFPGTTNQIAFTSPFELDEIPTFLEHLINITSHLEFFNELILSACLNIETLDDISFADFTNLKSLDLSKNSIVNLSSSNDIYNPILGNLSRLETLDLSCNKIHYIPSEIFSELSALKTLNLSANRISNISSHGFDNLIRLEYLDISANNISAVGRNVFTELVQLQYLNLSNNKIETLDGDCFSRLSRLQQLDVSRNQLTSVEPSALQALPSLARLTLAGNPQLGDLLVGTGRRLQAVDASQTGLAHVPPSLTRSVRTLRLAGNAIHTVRCGDLDSYPLLQLLDFASNGLENIEDDALGRLEMLFILYLSENKLRSVPRSLPASLKTLHLERNSIEKISIGHLSGLAQLEVLLLSDNDISLIEEGAFDELVSLVTLDISGNPLSVLGGGVFGGPARLQVLRLAGLPVATVARDTAFPVHAPEHLVSLDLTASPGLARMLLADTAALSAAKYLQELSLVDAGLIHIRSDLLSFLPQLRALRLTGNRLDCSGLLWLASWMRQQNREEDRTVLCSSPPDLAGSLLIDLQETDVPEVTTQKIQTSTIENLLNISTDSLFETNLTFPEITNISLLNGKKEEISNEIHNDEKIMNQTSLGKSRDEIPDEARNNTSIKLNNTNLVEIKSNFTTKKKMLHANAENENVDTKRLNMSVKYLNRSLYYQKNTSAKILRDLFIPESGIVNKSRKSPDEPDEKAMNYFDRKHPESISAASYTHGNEDVLHVDETAVHLKAVSEPRFILSPAAAIKSSGNTPDVVEEDVTSATGEMSMYRSRTGEEDEIANRVSRTHPGMLVLIAGVLGACVALTLAATKWGRRRRQRLRRTTTALTDRDQQQDDIEVSHLPGVTDLW